MRLTHIGAKNCVTGSWHLVQTRPDSPGGINILVDCGKAYGHDPELPPLTNFRFNPQTSTTCF
ncbi:hypothetical protein [Desulfobacula toluolica]|uniref:hypothetical protein n=1 Tax=Desulfobacula toluolica TaxID=28223 RepID=UPI0002F0A920|nr:hypothetical protein [Desulfobacula toluolica]